MRGAETSRWKLWTLLGGLYLAQGLPYGFFTQTLPVILRDSKASLAEIGGASLLVAPWALKFMWAPLVDRYGFQSLGLRRSWLIPIQWASVLVLVWLGLQDPNDGLRPIMWGVLLTRSDNAGGKTRKCERGVRGATRGADDRRQCARKRCVRCLTQRGPRARLVQFAGVGHAPTLIADDQVQAVADFLLG